ncbi:hypothetical protein Q5741_01375 [Paenibacillus sp. JX-17]|uniref:Uncharacterized protein n=1 Tax=Paenibacillus lacisoli TaxID=3064525 RepID=A0ABT9C730_9BACL|nr:hypothetical protein [Paenibacillus sp. JX-17]MDO7905061.1 hypothetical protein [Paenibacillus sp. JX-17]
MQTWTVQQVPPDRYFGQNIDYYRFIVKGHPLEKKYHTATQLNIMVSKGQVIGGTSFPDLEGLLGSVYSIEGRTLEEVQDMTYADWLGVWKKKYSPETTAFIKSEGRGR